MYGKATLTRGAPLPRTSVFYGSTRLSPRPLYGRRTEAQPRDNTSATRGCSTPFEPGLTRPSVAYRACDWRSLPDQSTFPRPPVATQVVGLRLSTISRERMVLR